MAWPPNLEQFESILDLLVKSLTQNIQTGGPITAETFQNLVQAELAVIVEEYGFDATILSKAQQFPDLALQPFGVEVKFTDSDSWRSVANSISEGQRANGIEHVYIVYGKAGGTPETRWRRYEDCVVHVRTSHRPRFEVDMEADGSLFDFWDITYQDFADLQLEGRMQLVRAYARGRLKPGERLWWLESQSDPEDTTSHALELGVRLYKNLPEEEKRRLRAEAAILNPEIVKSGRSRNKYDGVAMYLITRHGVLANQLRDLFSAGSVAHKSNKERGGIYVQRSLQNLEPELAQVAEEIPDELFEEYWGEVPAKGSRLKRWLERADRLATAWTPSQSLFNGTMLNDDMLGETEA